jgi:hypothetical protein
MQRFTQTPWRDVYSKIISAPAPLPHFSPRASTKPAAAEQQENNFHVRARRLDFIIVSSGEREREKKNSLRREHIEFGAIQFIISQLRWSGH